MSISQKTKESIADALAVAIQDAAVVESRRCTTNPTHYGISIETCGHVKFYFVTEPLGPGEGWIPLDE